MTDTVTFTFARPITVGDETITSLTFREATLGDAALGDKFEGATDKTLAVLAAMADVKLAVLKAVPMREFNRLMLAVGPLLGEQEAMAG